MSPTDLELHTALMALRAIAFQAEKHLDFLSGIAASEDALDRADIEYTQNCLDALKPAILWLEDRVVYRQKKSEGDVEIPADI